jgi:hypothetical protein
VGWETLWVNEVEFIALRVDGLKGNRVRILFKGGDEISSEFEGSERELDGREAAVSKFATDGLPSSWPGVQQTSVQGVWRRQ